MSKYIIAQPKPKHTNLAWISLILMTSNIYHTRLMILLGLYSEASTVLIQGAAVLCFCAYLALEGKLRSDKMRIRMTDVWMALSWIVILLSVRDFRENLTYIIRYGVYVAVVVLFRQDEKIVRIGFWCMVAAGLLHIVFTFWFRYDLNFYLRYIFPSFTAAQQEQLYGQVVYHGYASGIAVHYSVNGMYMAITLCCSFVLLQEKRRKGLAAILFLVNLLALFMTGKRGVILFAVFAMLAAHFLLEHKKRWLGVLLGVSVCGVLLFWLSHYIESAAATLERLYEMFYDGGTDVSTGRFGLYKEAWALFLEHPLTGIGWREFTREANVYFGGQSQLMDTHNVFLQLLCETGIFGFGVFAALFASAYGKTLKLAVLYRKGRIELAENQKMLLYFSVCYQTFFLCYCMTGNPLYDHETLFAYVLSVAAVGALEEQDGTNGIGNYTGL